MRFSRPPLAFAAKIRAREKIIQHRRTGDDRHQNDEKPDGDGGDYRQVSNFQTTPLISTTDEPDPLCVLGDTHSLGADNSTCTTGVEIPNTLPISR